MPHIIHLIGAYSLFVGIFAQIIVIATGWRQGKKPAVVQAAVLLVALLLDSASIILRPHQPPQLLPDLLGCGAALLLFAPAVEAGRKMWAEKQGGEDPEK